MIPVSMDESGFYKDKSEPKSWYYARTRRIVKGAKITPKINLISSVTLTNLPLCFISPNNTRRSSF